MSVGGVSIDPGEGVPWTCLLGGVACCSGVLSRGNVFGPARRRGVRDTVVREVKEETGIDVEVTGLVGLYTNPAHVMAYDDG
jgi:8-oxo-dGTP pyrophosphatase MutT (NUDIX family)